MQSKGLSRVFSNTTVQKHQFFSGGDTPCPRAHEKPQQDGRRGKIVFRIKPHTRQRCSEGSNKPCANQDPETPQRLCVGVSCGVWVSSGLLRGQGLWVQYIWVWHKPSWRRSPLTHHGATRTYTGLGKQTLGGHRQKLVCPRAQKKGAVAPQEPDPDLPRSVQESLRGLGRRGPLQGWGH